MKIKFEFPNGYKSEMQTARDANDFDAWVIRKFIRPIRPLISDQFTMDIQPSHFIIDFVEDEDAEVFLTVIGGRVVYE
ncbi:hypothetical protein [Sinorhizobium fredii]|uniref:hypothetical protein n=1 Tax=Rhizobium fredii TaxID=380 RepID=UPI0004B7D2DC|nr:hypothetical protein [Sinorhizobium fredii]AWI60358.1 hypothetical protein AB395_00005181 [Sinorhizobium fredii CCBAU 45436]